MRSRASDSRLWIGRRRRRETSRRQFESARGYSFLCREDRQRLRQDREPQRMPADELAVEVEHLLRRLNRGLAGAERTDFLQPQVFAPPQRWKLSSTGFEIEVAKSDSSKPSGPE